MATVEGLAQFLFDDPDDDALADEVAAWLATSPRFRSFATTHRDKIRKKLRGAPNVESRRDVRAELRVAHLLLADRRVEVAFEAYGSGKPGPDFTITTRGSRLNLEVTRLRGDPVAAGFGGLLAKVRQLPPSVPNGVLLSIEGTDAAAYDVEAAVRALRGRADAIDDELFTARGFSGTEEFYRRFARLGAVIVWCEGADVDRRVAAWSNPSARIAMPARALRACLACLRER